MISNDHWLALCDLSIHYVSGSSSYPIVANDEDWSLSLRCLCFIRIYQYRIAGFYFCVYSIPRRYYLFLLAFVYCVLFLDLTDMNIVLMSRRSALEYIFIR